MTISLENYFSGVDQPRPMTIKKVSMVGGVSDGLSMDLSNPATVHHLLVYPPPPHVPRAA